MISQDNLDRIEAFLSGNLNDQEVDSFLATVEDDQELQAELTRRETAHQALDFLVAENLRQEFRSLEETRTKTGGRVIQLKRKKIYRLAIAASAVILIGAMFFLMPGGSDINYATYYERPTFTVRGGQNASLPQAIQGGLNAWETQNYEGVISEVDVQDIPADYQGMAAYLKAHALYNLDRYQEAQSSFANVISANDLRYREEAQWYELLSCLQTDAHCDNLLSALLANPSHPYHDQVKTLTEAIK